MNKAAVYSDFKNFISIPSVSADSDRFSEIEKAAAFLEDKLREVGCKVHTLRREGFPPCIIGVLMSPEKNASTIGIYGHYDVQPEDPLDEWQSDPFTLTIRDGKMYGRGVADSKGHLIQSIAAVSSLVKQKKLNNSIIFIFEGEEESSGAHFEEYMVDVKDLLSAVDVFYIVDMGMHGKDAPQIFYALRGMVYFELTIQTGSKDLHSGVYGNAVFNPAHILSSIINAMRDMKTGKIMIPNFYNAMQEVDAYERSLLRKVERTREALREETGVYTLAANTVTQSSLISKLYPSFDVHGMVSGYTGSGAKTIIPHEASAKFSFRLVEHQDPDDIEKHVRAFIKRQIPAGVQHTLTSYGHAMPFHTSIDSHYMRKTADVLTQVFGNDTLFNRSGGTIPAAEILKRLFKKPIILTGFTLPDDNLHAPNENIDEEMFWKGIEALQEIYSSYY